MNRIALVIGGSSPIGSEVARQLAAQHTEVLTTSRVGSASSIQLDLLDLERLVELLGVTRPTTIAFLAGPRADAAEKYRAITENAFRRLVAVSAEFGIRVLLASSAAVYGTRNTGASLETDALRPEGSYGEMKVALEEILLEGREQLGLTGTALRIFNAYGPGLDRSLINRIFAATGPPPEVYRTAGFVRDYVHVTDIGRAFSLVATANSSSRHCINVGTGVATNNMELLALPRARAIPIEVTEGWSSWSVADIAALKSEFGFRPAVSLNQFVRDPHTGLGRVDGGPSTD